VIDNKDSLIGKIVFKEIPTGITVGQSAVFYNEQEEMIGGGVIKSVIKSSC